MTLQQHWDDCIGGDASSPHRWMRPVLKSRITVAVHGFTFCPHRIRTDGQVFHLDSYLRDGRTLRLILPPDFTCERLPYTSEAPLPSYEAAERLGFCARDPYRAVTDIDRLVLDLTAST